LFFFTSGTDRMQQNMIIQWKWSKSKNIGKCKYFWKEKWKLEKKFRITQRVDSTEVMTVKRNQKVMKTTVVIGYLIDLVRPAHAQWIKTLPAALDSHSQCRSQSSSLVINQAEFYRCFSSKSLKSDTVFKRIQQKIKRQYSRNNRGKCDIFIRSV